MPRSARRLGWLLALPLLGCGTMKNIEGVPRDSARPWMGRTTTPYGGVVYDANLVAKHASKTQIIPMLVAGSDIPASLFADTITLPYVLTKKRR